MDDLVDTPVVVEEGASDNGAGQSAGSSDPFGELLHRLRGDFLGEMPAAEVVLSAGCAGSWYFQWFEERYPHQIRKHIGFDLGPAPENLPANVEWHNDSFVTPTSIADKSVDLVFAGQAIEHVSASECRDFLIHANRILVEGGLLVLDSPNFSVTGPTRYLHPEHVIEYTTPQITEILTAAGFKVVKRKGILLCISNGKLVSDPLNIATIDDWRIKAARERPEDSFIWWIEATRIQPPNVDKLSRLLTKIEGQYERERAAFNTPAPVSRNGASPAPVQNTNAVSGGRKIVRWLPYRLRWFVRASYRVITGRYLRESIRRMDAVSHQVSVFSAHMESQGEVLDLVLRRMRLTDDRISGQLSLLAEKAAAAEHRLGILTDPLPRELSSVTADILNYDRSHLGFRAHHGVWLNEPLILEYTPKEVRWVMTIERILEVPFVFQGLATAPPPARILDVGCCESLVPLELASVGYEVTAIDVRKYPFSHPNLKVVTESVVDWQGDGVLYDAVILLSTIEHLGLAVYGQPETEGRLDLAAMDSILKLLKPGGLLVLTTPFGRSRTDPTQRVYSAADVERLLQGYKVRDCAVGRRGDDKTWLIDRDLPFETLGKYEPSDDQEAVALVVAEKS